VNRSVAEDEMLSGCQIHRFLILHKELDADDGELTRTRKVRRRIIEEKFGDLIDALYGGKSEQYTETEVTYEDGRKGKIRATLEIRDAAVWAMLAGRRWRRNDRGDAARPSVSPHPPSRGGSPMTMPGGRFLPAGLRGVLGRGAVRGEGRVHRAGRGHRHLRGRRADDRDAAGFAAQFAWAMVALLIYGLIGALIFRSGQAARERSGMNEMTAPLSPHEGYTPPTAARSAAW
jgi:hypothetical protein